MEFNLKLKSLSDALDLGVINSNVSKFYQKSCLAQLTATKEKLIVNLEASRILTEIDIPGSSDIDEVASIFVDSLLLKQLVSTLEYPDLTLEFTPNVLILHSGKSKFNLPKVLDAEDLAFNKPSTVTGSESAIDLDSSAWKYVKDTQMYAIAMSVVNPVYTNVWAGELGDVIVGDFDNSLFTHSKSSNLKKTCLLTDTIINLFNSVPEGAKIIPVNDKYVIEVLNDEYHYICEFSPKYESDENVGSYNSDIILKILERPETGYVATNRSLIYKYLSQAELLSSGSDATITFEFRGNDVVIKDQNIECILECESHDAKSYTAVFKLSMIKDVFNSYTDNRINIAPMMQDDELGGIVVWDDKLTSVLAVIEE